MKRPQDVPMLADAIAWLAWFATILGSMSSAADMFHKPPRRKTADDDEGERVDNATDIADVHPRFGRRGDRSAAR